MLVSSLLAVDTFLLFVQPRLCADVLMAYRWNNCMQDEEYSPVTSFLKKPFFKNWYSE